MSGQGTLFSHSANGDIHEYHLSAGQGFLICPGQINLYTADEQEPWKYVWLEFDGLRTAGISYPPEAYQCRRITAIYQFPH